MFCLPTTPKAVVAQAERLGAAGRIAYDLGGGVVAKLHGEKDNLNEASIWNAVKDHPSLARYFAPIYDCAQDGEWQLMKRLTNAQEAGRRWGHNDKVADEARRAFMEAGWKVYLSDLHSGNWGRDEDGSLKILDYAYCCLVDPAGNVHGHEWLLRYIDRGENGQNEP